MAQPDPVIYLLHGEDEFSIAQYVDEIKRKIGDPAMLDMNLTRLDGRTIDLDGWFGIASTIPFLAPRRVTILTNPTARLATPEAREKFKKQLTELPTTAVLILQAERVLVDKRGKPEWLLAWAQQARPRVEARAFPLPKGDKLQKWVMERARMRGGQFTPAAAKRLLSLIDEDTRLADQEIQKALLFVNYQRPVEAADVEMITPDSAGGKIFEMVDALSVRDGRKALGMLERLLKQDEPFSIFGMIVRQFRMLLLARSIVDLGGGERQVIEGLGSFPRPSAISSYPAQKAYDQCHRFSLAFLEKVYGRLLEVDVAMKSSQMEPEVALEVFVVEFTSQPATAPH